METIGKWVSVSVKDFDGITYDQWKQSIPKEWNGIHKTTLYQALTWNLTAKLGFSVKVANDRTLAVLKDVRKGNKKVEGIQVVEMDNDKYSISNLNRLNPFYDMTFDEQNALDAALLQAEKQTDMLTSGMVMKNTSMHMAQTVCFGIRQNPQGGTYFIHQNQFATFREYVDRIRTFLGGESIVSMRCPTVVNDGDSLEAVNECAQESLMGDFEAVVKKINDAKSQRGYESRLADIAEMIKQANFYEELVGYKFDNLKKLLELQRDFLSLQIHLES